MKEAQDVRFLEGYFVPRHEARSLAAISQVRQRENSGDLPGALRGLAGVIRLNPKCPGVYTWRSSIRHSLGDCDGAVKDAHKAIHLHPENLDAFVRLAYLCGERKLPRKMLPNEQEELIGIAEEILRDDPSCAWAYVLRAEAVGRRWSPKDALRCLQDLKHAVALDPKRAWMRAFLGRALTASEEPKAMKEGLAELAAAVRLAPESGWMLAWRAQVLEKSGRGRRALTDLDRALKLDPLYRLALAWRAEVREKLGDDAGAVEDMTACLAALPRATFYHRRAVILLRLRRTTAALEDLTRCSSLSLHYDFAYGGFEFLLNLFDNVGREWRPENKAALLKSRPLLREIQGKIFNDKTGVFCGGRSSAFLALKTEQLEKAVRKFPRQALVHAWLGRSYLNAGRWEESLLCLERALALDFRCASALAWRGEARCRMGDCAQAANDLGASLLFDQPPASAKLWLGAAFLRLGRKEEGLAQWVQAGRTPADFNMIFWWSRWILPGFWVPNRTNSRSVSLSMAEIAKSAGKPARALRWLRSVVG